MSSFQAGFGGVSSVLPPPGMPDVSRILAARPTSVLPITTAIAQQSAAAGFPLNGEEMGLLDQARNTLAPAVSASTAMKRQQGPAQLRTVVNRTMGYLNKLWAKMQGRKPEVGGWGLPVNTAAKTAKLSAAAKAAGGPKGGFAAMMKGSFFPAILLMSFNLYKSGASQKKTQAAISELQGEFDLMPDVESLVTGQKSQQLQTENLMRLSQITGSAPPMPVAAQGEILHGSVGGENLTPEQIQAMLGGA